MMDKRAELMSFLLKPEEFNWIWFSVHGQFRETGHWSKESQIIPKLSNGLLHIWGLLTRLPLSIYPLGHLESRWEAAQVKIREIALDSLRLSSSDRAAFMKIKWQLVFFTHALEMFGYPEKSIGLIQF